MLKESLRCLQSMAVGFVSPRLLLSKPSNNLANIHIMALKFARKLSKLHRFVKIKSLFPGPWSKMNKFNTDASESRTLVRLQVLLAQKYFHF